MTYHQRYASLPVNKSANKKENEAIVVSGVRTLSLVGGGAELKGIVEGGLRPAALHTAPTPMIVYGSIQSCQVEHVKFIES